MAILTPATMTTKSTLVRVNGIWLRNINNISNLDGGTTELIDDTSLEDDARTYSAGLKDAGEISLSGMAAPQSDAYAALEDARDSGNNVEFTVVFGASDADAYATQGKGRVVKSGISTTVSGTGGTNDPVKFSIGDSKIPGVIEGDYIEYRTGVAPGTAATQKITAVGRTGSSAEMTAGGLSSAVTLTTGSTQSIIRPAYRRDGQILVTQMALSVAVNGNISVDMTFRVNGSLTKTLGTPDLTL